MRHAHAPLARAAIHYAHALAGDSHQAMPTWMTSPYPYIKSYPYPYLYISPDTNLHECVELGEATSPHLASPIRGDENLHHVMGHKT
jgi:hypothetical protein